MRFSIMISMATILLLVALPSSSANAPNIRIGRGFSDVAIAIDPRNSMKLVVADGSLYATVDGGVSWSRKSVSDRGDPVVTYDKNGKLFYVGLSGAGISFSAGKVIMSLSADGGGSWAPDIVVGSARGSITVDKPWLAVDTSNSSWTGRLYVVWTNLDHDSSGNEIASNITLSTSSDGAHFTAPRTIVQGHPFAGQMPYALVGSSGELYVFWVNIYTDPAPISMAVSRDGGETFSQPKTVAMAIDQLPGRRGGVGGLPGTKFGVWSIPAAALDPVTGYLYVVWADNRNGDADIFFVMSSDHGVTWSTPRRVNDDPIRNHKDQFQPAIATAKDGAIHIVFLDRRDDPKNVEYRVYYTVSLDHGKSFVPNVMISDASSNANKLSDPTFIGDYIGVVVDSSGVVHTAWNDCRNNQLEAFTSSFSLSQIGVTVTRTDVTSTSTTSVMASQISSLVTAQTHSSTVSLQSSPTSTEPAVAQQASNNLMGLVAGAVVAIVLIGAAITFRLRKRQNK